MLSYVISFPANLHKKNILLKFPKENKVTTATNFFSSGHIFSFFSSFLKNFSLTKNIGGMEKNAIIPAIINIIFISNLNIQKNMNAIKLPAIAPAVSKARCIPYASPLLSLYKSPINASLGEPLMPLPILSTLLKKTRCHHWEDKGKNNFEIADKLYPDVMNIFLLPNLSERCPEKILEMLAIPSPKPAIIPKAMPPPPKNATKNGKIGNIISLLASAKKLMIPSKKISRESFSMKKNKHHIIIFCNSS